MGSIEEIIEEFNEGKLDVESAKCKLMESFYERSDEFFLDLQREERLGFPEVIYGQGKSFQVLQKIVKRVITEKNITFVSGLDDDKIEPLSDAFEDYYTKAAGDSLI